ncbi:MAG: single-stranded DNA-binding protein [Pseudomonadota bacterium]|nr:single-stranded DNA-binding protein [Pseudomonadota bacterium]
MASLNQCNFIGNVAKIETRYLPNGDAVTKFTLAVNETWKKDGEKQERVEWVNCVVYRRLAEIAEKYVTKGMPLFVSGKLQTRKWQDKEGQDRYSTEIIVNELQMLGSKGGQESRPAQQEQPGMGDEFVDQDIPF